MFLSVSVSPEDVLGFSQAPMTRSCPERTPKNFPDVSSEDHWLSRTTPSIPQLQHTALGMTEMPLNPVQSSIIFSSYSSQMSGVFLAHDHA